MENVKKHINKLIDSLPTNNLNILNTKIDIIFEGGLFNGSYLIGALYYLKQLEDRNLISINRISGCSVGSLISLIYFTNKYDLTDVVYKLTYRHFKKNLNVDIFDKIFIKFRQFITDDVMKKLNGKLFITYYNIKTNKQIVKNTYTDVDDLFNTIRKSCHCPYIVDNSFLYKKKYVDGFYPYMFNDQLTNNKILYLNIHNFDKLFNSISIKNEKTNYSRVLCGILDIHKFFSTNLSTSMCSYVNDWTIVEKISNLFFVYLLKLIPYLMHNIYALNKAILKSKTGTMFDFYNNALRSTYLYILKTYCV